MKKELCDCKQVATWCYMPGFSSGANPHFCDNCVPRGCSCNWNSTLEDYPNQPEGIKDVDFKWIDSTTWVSIDEHGREYPCVEYMYDSDGWEIEYVMEEQEFLDSLINLTEEEATNKVNENGYYVRVTQRDGREYMITCDFTLNRINFHIENGLITKATTG